VQTTFSDVCDDSFNSCAHLPALCHLLQFSFFSIFQVFPPAGTKIREENLFFENARFWYKKVEEGVP
jgi:hypothetical protein